MLPQRADSLASTNENSVEAKLPLRRVVAVAVPCALLWGSAFPSIKFVYAHWTELGIEPGTSGRWLFAGLRFFLAGIALLLLARSPLAELKRSPWVSLALFGLFQTFLQYLFLYWGIQFASGMLAALSVVLGSLWWVILAPLFKKSSWPSKLAWLALISTAGGTVLAVAAPGEGGSNPVLGFSILALAQLSGALALVVLPNLRSSMGARAATGWSLAVGGAALFLCGASAWPRVPELFDLPVLSVTTWLAFVSAAAFAMWNWLVTRAEVSLLATWRFLIPLSGATQSVFFLDEKPGWGLFVGGAIALVSMTFALRLEATKG